VADQEETDMLRARSITTIGAVVALAVPAAAGAQQDLRTPDAIDARDNALIIKSQRQDRRSPDAVEAARTPSPAPTRIVPTRIAPPQPAAADGFEWGDAGIGAAGMLGLLGLAGGTAALTLRRRHGVRPSH
jgi:hypothetical protein